MTTALAARPARVHHRLLPGAAVAVAVGVAALWAALGLVRQHTMRTGIDLGLYTQAVAGYAHGGLPWSTLKTADGRFDLLGDHFTPVMALLAPAYRLWPHPATLVVAQALLVGLGAGVLARTAGRVFGTPAAAALAGLALGLAWGTAGLALFDVHEVAFAVPLLAVVVDRAVADRWGAAVAWAVPLLLVKEDGAFLLAGLGLACWAVGRRRLGVVTSGGAVLGWWLTTGVVIPALSWSGRYTYWATLGDAGPDPLATAGRVVLAATSTPGLSLLALAAATTLGIGLRSPLVWVVVPPLLARFGTAHAGYWGPGAHYDATLVVVLVGTVLDAVHRGWWRQWRPRLTRGVPAVLLLVAVAGSLLAGPLRAATNPGFYACARCPAARAALAVVPDGARVAADTYLVDQLVDRTTTYLLAPGLRDSVDRPVDPGWVVADRRSGAWPGPAAVDATLRLAADRGCTTRFDRGDFVVLRCPV